MYSVWDLTNTECRTVRKAPAPVLMVRLLLNTNILALVMDDGAAFTKNDVYIWDDSRNTCVGKLCFKYPVTDVKLHYDIIVAATIRKLHTHSLKHLLHIESLDTQDAPVFDVCG